jgi:hypothetical protein
MTLNYIEESLKSKISRIFKKDEITRNNYACLYFALLEELGYKIIVDKNLIPSMPSPESVTRVARTIQNNEQQFTPSDETYEKRKKNFNESKEFYSGLNKNNQFCY